MEEAYDAPSGVGPVVFAGQGLMTTEGRDTKGHLHTQAIHPHTYPREASATTAPFYRCRN